MAQDALMQTALVLVGAAVAGTFAIQNYFRQREHELILARYLEGSLDLLAAEMGRVSEVFSHNWARCLALIKSYRDLGEDFDVDQLSQGFREIHASNHNVIAHHRLYALVGTYDYWYLYQKAMAYFSSANSVLVKEIPEVIRLKVASDRITESRETVVEQAFTEAKAKDDKGHVYLRLIDELQALAAVLEARRYRLRRLQQFRRRREVQESVERVRKLLASVSDGQSDEASGEAREQK